MFGIGMPELIIILAVALIVIGPKKLPELAKSLGRALGEFKRAANDLKESIYIEDEVKDVKNTLKNFNKDTHPYLSKSDGKADTSKKPAAKSIDEGSEEKSREDKDQGNENPKSEKADLMDKLKENFDKMNQKVDESADVSVETPPKKHTS